jgi:hypothetical protein
MAFTLNGIGTTYYGKREGSSDGSYITTEWFVFLYLPLYPIRSLRIIPRGIYKNYIFYSSEGFYSYKVPLNIKQIRNIYLGTYGIIGAVILLISIFI